MLVSGANSVVDKRGRGPNRPSWQLQCRLLSKIGNGTFGTVYAAEYMDPAEANPKQPFALKVIDCANNHEAIRRYAEYEARVHYGLRHPNLVTMRDYLIADSAIYLVLELARGGDLRELLTRFPRPTAHTVHRLFRQLISSSLFLWDRGLVHRDQKPDNYLVAEPVSSADGLADAKLWMADLGFIRLSDQPGPNSRVGSAAYLAPEVLLGDVNADPIDSEKYTLGVIVYEMFEGYRVTPFEIAQGRLGQNISSCPAGLDLFKKLTERSASSRIKIRDIERHPFFTGHSLVRRPIGGAANENKSQFSEGDSAHSMRDEDDDDDDEPPNSSHLSALASRTPTHRRISSAPVSITRDQASVRAGSSFQATSHRRLHSCVLPAAQSAPQDSLATGLRSGEIDFATLSDESKLSVSEEVRVSSFTTYEGSSPNDVFGMSSLQNLAQDARADKRSSDHVVDQQAESAAMHASQAHSHPPPHVEHRAPIGSQSTSSSVSRAPHGPQTQANDGSGPFQTPSVTAYLMKQAQLAKMQREVDEIVESKRAAAAAAAQRTAHSALTSPSNYPPMSSLSSNGAPSSQMPSSLNAAQQSALHVARQRAMELERASLLRRASQSVPARSVQSGGVHHVVTGAPRPVPTLTAQQWALQQQLVSGVTYSQNPTLSASHLPMLMSAGGTTHARDGMQNPLYGVVREQPSDTMYPLCPFFQAGKQCPHGSLCPLGLHNVNLQIRNLTITSARACSSFLQVSTMDNPLCARQREGKPCFFAHNVLSRLGAPLWAHALEHVTQGN